MNQINRIILSRIDNLGDVMLTLPMAGALKKQYPEIEIVFLGKKYTRDIIDCSKYIDAFIDFEIFSNKNTKQQIDYIKQLNADVFIHVFPNKHLSYIAYKAKIKNRIGTSHRFYHWFFCNKLVHLGRRNSELHEAQLNLNLLTPLKIDTNFKLNEIYRLYGFDKTEKLDVTWQNLLDKSKFNIVLHPKSKGSAREWGLDNFTSLIHLLPKSRFKVFITGTAEEGMMIQDFLKENEGLVTDMTGKLSLNQLIAFIKAADGLVAASTGPLHIAAALGKKVIGIYPPIKPMHPGRWAPLGLNAGYLVLNKECNDCRKTMDCTCIRDISPVEVMDRLTENL